MKKVLNSVEHPEAWKFWVEQCRNITEEPSVNRNGRFMYRIPKPDLSGEFLYGETLYTMWVRFITFWYECQNSLNAPTVRGKIQYIVNTFNN